MYSNSFDRQQRVFNIFFWGIVAFVGLMFVGIITVAIVGFSSGKGFYAQHPECIYTRCVTILGNESKTTVVVPVTDDRKSDR